MRKGIGEDAIVNRFLTRCAWAFLIHGALLANGATAQTPAGQEIRKVYTNRATITLPVRIDERECKYVRELQFFVRPGPEAPWVLKESAPASQREFVFQAPQDGEYWFSVVTVDHKGIKNPADLTREAPGLVVVVDTVPPVPQVRTLRMPSGDMFFYCEVDDTHPDPSKTKMEYQSAAKTWMPLEPFQQQPGFYRVPDPTVIFSTVRVSAADRAGNIATREVKLSTTAEAAAPRQPAVEKKPEVTSVTSAASADAVTQESTTAAPVKEIERTVTPVVHEVKSPALVDSSPTSLPPAIRRQAEPITPTAATAGAPTKPAVQLVNDKHVFMEYLLDRGGAGKVEVWASRDDGRTWQHIADDADLRSPVEFDLPGEGVYSLRLVVTDGSDGKAPAAGETPDWCVEVDCTKPAAQLLAVVPSKEETGVYLVSWNAFDKNMKPDGIDLYYALNSVGPWQPIARKLRNDGGYRWTLGAEAPRSLFIRLEVTDQAGNMTRCEQRLQTPADALPRARVTGLTTASQLQSVKN